MAPTGWQAARYLGMSVEMLEKVYGHHHPDHLQKAVAAIRRSCQKKAELKQIVFGAVGFAAEFKTRKI